VQKRSLTAKGMPGSRVSVLNFLSNSFAFLIVLSKQVVINELSFLLLLASSI